MISDEEVNDAIIYSLTHTKTGAPIIDEPDFFDHYVDDRSAELLEAVYAILNEAMTIQVDWNTRSLIDGGHYVKGVMHERYPFLSDEALGLVGGYYTYRWR